MHLYRPVRAAWFGVRGWRCAGANCRELFELVHERVIVLEVSVHAVAKACHYLREVFAQVSHLNGVVHRVLCLYQQLLVPFHRLRCGTQCNGDGALQTRLDKQVRLLLYCVAHALCCGKLPFAKLCFLDLAKGVRLLPDLHALSGLCNVSRPALLQRGYAFLNLSFGDGDLLAGLVARRSPEARAHTKGARQEAADAVAPACYARRVPQPHTILCPLANFRLLRPVCFDSRCALRNALHRSGQGLLHAGL